MLPRRSLLIGLSAAAAAPLLGKPAHATVSRALALDELVRVSKARVIGTPIDRSSMWEAVGGNRRIVTYTIVRLEGALDGRSADSGDVAVRTLGGVVGDIGQRVHGEAALRVGERGSLFLADLGKDVYTVAGLAQGHFPTLADEAGAQRLYMSPQVPPLLRSSKAAVLTLHGQTVLDARELVIRELSRNAR